MGEPTSDPVSITILILLMFISCVLVGYVGMFLYARYKKSKGENYFALDLFQPSFLDSERKPLIPGSLHTRTIQPVLSHNDTEEDDVMDEVDHFKERDFSKLGRIIFVMRYNKKREELMVRLVQIEGLPVSQELYSPNSAYVDVQLKYTGSTVGDDEEEVQQPPRLDICLQQVYYFIISTQQMLSHSLEFQINTFDEQFRRFVSGLVEVNLYQELGEDILTGNEVVFVKEIMEPFRYSEEQKLEDEDFVSAVSDLENEQKLSGTTQNQREIGDQGKFQTEEKKAGIFRSLSRESDASSRASNMSWEPEVSKDLLHTSMTSLFQRCISEQDLSMNPLTEAKRSHSIGYLPMYEWTVKEIELDEDDTKEESHLPVSSPYENEITSTFNDRNKTKITTDYYKIYDDIPTSDNEFTFDDNPPPESFYKIVPESPFMPLTENPTRMQEYQQEDLLSSPINSDQKQTSPRKVAYKKHSLMKTVSRSWSMRRNAAPKPAKLRKLQRTERALERSSSWPTMPATEKEDVGDSFTCQP